jgi:hypothetical protein
MRFTTGLIVFPLLAGALSPAQASSQVTATVDRASFDSGTVSVRWNRLVPSFVAEAAARRRAVRAAAAGDSAALRRITQTPPPQLFTIYTLISVAQYGALRSIANNRDASSSAAVAAASAAVLTELFTDSVVRESIKRELKHDFDKAGGEVERVRAANRLGADVARRVIAAAPQLQLMAPYTGTIPTGPGKWYSAPKVPPIGIAMATARGWLLDSASQFRPAPPPAFGSSVWLAAMDEVKRVARDLTLEQAAIARRWNSADPWAEWNEKAARAIQAARLPEAEAVRVLATLNVATSDVIIACFEAKYHYWTIRPTQADSTLALPDSLSVPNFPSYPSGHACSAGSFEAVLSHFFPAQRDEFGRMSAEQAMSRLYGGVHYRFDNDDGLALGRVVAAHAIAQERAGKLMKAWQSQSVGR